MTIVRLKTTNVADRSQGEEVRVRPRGRGKGNEWVGKVKARSMGTRFS